MVFCKHRFLAISALVFTVGFNGVTTPLVACGWLPSFAELQNNPQDVWVLGVDIVAMLKKVSDEAQANGKEVPTDLKTLIDCVISGKPLTNEIIFDGLSAGIAFSNELQGDTGVFAAELFYAYLTKSFPTKSLGIKKSVAVKAKSVRGKRK